ncbi:HAMP domain-containing histidine kinase [Antarcticibacterium flavum]|uniref:histidine kinase n=1 Tax=Antarcticibacterium flavum TaxID=2058175 RepID=A0A5B7X0L3_9FLAO|nr:MULTISPECIES: HAMP domain-containing sensor histidine kinase [Antarcticibacterium]QCY68198.1 HAMP domain-containing histidine kinase [Antarcticibacterium flavum]
MKIKYKIAAIFSLICSAMIGLTGIFLYILFEDNLENRFEERLLQRAVLAAEILLEKDELNESTYEAITLRYLQKLPAEKVFYLRTNNGVINYSQIPVEFANVNEIETAIEEDYNFFEVGKLKVCSLYYEDNQGNYIVLLAARDLNGEEQLNFLQRTIWIIIITALFIIALISLLFANQILKPINSMISRVQEIRSNKLELRLDEGKGKDEISRLAQTFNEMLSRLENSFYTQRKFIQNASHELRTPLTVILGEAEYALKSGKLEEDQEMAMQKIYQQADHLRQLLNSLLQLSEIRNDNFQSSFEILRLDELVQQVVINTNQTISAGKIHLEYKDTETLSTDSFEILGNELWLEIAFTNLLTNALKYSGNKPVKVTLLHAREKVEVFVEDKGIGIANDEIEKIFTPFYRGSNAGTKKGYGIGLALTRNIVKIHKGEINIESRPNKGSIIKVELPKAVNF